MLRNFHVVLIVTAICFQFTISTARAEDPLNLLFFGNSFTQVNNVPASVSNLAVADGHPTPLIVADLQGGQYLSYHIGQVDNYPANNVNNAAIAGKTWDYVVIQGYSTESLTAPATFRTNAQTLYTKVRDHASGHGSGVTAVLYETWARPDLVNNNTYPSLTSMQNGITTQYRLANDGINAAQGNGSSRVATVGEAFEAMNFDLALYGSDKYHASTTGSLLSAMVIYRTIYNEKVGDINFADVQSWSPVSQSTWASLALIADAAPIVIPEPTTLALLALGSLSILRRRHA